MKHAGSQSQQRQIYCSSASIAWLSRRLNSASFRAKERITGSAFRVDRSRLLARILDLTLRCCSASVWPESTSRASSLSPGGAEKAIVCVGCIHKPFLDRQDRSKVSTGQPSGRDAAVIRNTRGQRTQTAFIPQNITHVVGVIHIINNDMGVA